ncbi:MAG TPA: hypothetical protein VMT91_00010 [Anaerolineales bacterium]|nr:hypothetical protein [Anaerolineales bacterium]
MDWIIRILRGIETGLFLFFFAILLAGSSLLYSAAPGEAARRYTRPVEFDFVNWTLDAVGVKLGQASLGTPFYFEASGRHQLVVDYFHLMDTILQDEDKLNLIYSNPSVKDPAKASASLRNELSKLYARQSQLDPMAESILQDQVSTTLAEEGLTTGGQPIPPVLFHLTPLPYNLIISPRSKIQEDASISLIPDLTVDQQAVLEGKVDKGLNVSSLVVPVGGIGTYPTMIERTTALDWLTDTIAHEWTHNWLATRPLGLNYEASPQTRTMNETTADIVGGEVGKALLARYYPEIAAQYAMQIQLDGLSTAPAKAGFDFRAEMHTTRVHVDALLAAGKITEAETYMNQRRQVFWDNGYPIRKLNQAYFAFYGAYADVPGGAAGEDPVGPAVRALRAQSSSLAAFLETIARMSSFQQLLNALAH